jgi:hypothetical protein
MARRKADAEEVWEEPVTAVSAGAGVDRPKTPAEIA